MENDELEPTSPEAARDGTLNELREIVAFIARNPEIIVPCDLPETMARAAEAMNALDDIQYAV